MAHRSPKLETLFRYYNRKFFSNQLPKDTRVEWSRTMHRAGLLGDVSFNTMPQVIRISIKAAYSLAFYGPILLHECNHLDTWLKEKPDHGPKFKKGIRRLFLAGAYSDLL